MADNLNGTLSFSMALGNIDREIMRIAPQCNFGSDDVTFFNDIPIIHGYNGTFTACFPYKSNIDFAVKIDNTNNYWPREDCQDWLGTLEGYLGSDLAYTTDCIIEPDEFTTSSNNTIYQLPDHDNNGAPGKKVDLDFKWKFRINGGPKRQMNTNVTHFTIFNGFRANDISAPDLPETGLFHQIHPLS